MPPLPLRSIPKVTEGDVRKSIEIALNKQGLVRVFLNAQYSGPARGGYTRAGLGTGTADLIGYVLGSGRFFALEVKTGKGVVSPEQAAWLAQTNREGGYAAVVRSPEEACAHARKALGKLLNASCIAEFWSYPDNRWCEFEWSRIESTGNAIVELSAKHTLLGQRYRVSLLDGTVIREWGGT